MASLDDILRIRMQQALLDQEARREQIMRGLSIQRRNDALTNFEDAQKAETYRFLQENQPTPEEPKTLSLKDYLGEDFKDKSQATQAEILEAALPKIREEVGDEGLYAVADFIKNKPTAEYKVDLDPRKGIVPRQLESNFLGDVAGTIISSPVALAESASGLLNAAFDVEPTRALANTLKGSTQAVREAIQSEAQQDFNKRTEELIQQGRYADVYGNFADNKAKTLATVADMLVPSVLAAKIGTVGARAGSKLLTKSGKEVAKDATEEAAKKGSRAVDLTGASGGMAVLPSGMLAQDLSDEEGNLDTRDRLATFAALGGNTALGIPQMALGYSIPGMVAGVKGNALSRGTKQLSTRAANALYGTGIDAATNTSMLASTELLRQWAEDKGYDIDRLKSTSAYGYLFSPIVGGTPGAMRGPRARPVVDPNTGEKVVDPETGEPVVEPAAEAEATVDPTTVPPEATVDPTTVPPEAEATVDPTTVPPEAEATVDPTTVPPEATVEVPKESAPLSTEEATGQATPREAPIVDPLVETGPVQEHEERLAYLERNKAVLESLLDGKLDPKERLRYERDLSDTNQEIDANIDSAISSRAEPEPVAVGTLPSMDSARRVAEHPRSLISMGLGIVTGTTNNVKSTANFYKFHTELVDALNSKDPTQGWGPFLADVLKLPKEYRKGYKLRNSYSLTSAIHEVLHLVPTVKNSGKSKNDYAKKLPYRTAITLAELYNRMGSDILKTVDTFNRIKWIRDQENKTANIPKRINEFEKEFNGLMKSLDPKKSEAHNQDIIYSIRKALRRLEILNEKAERSGSKERVTPLEGLQVEDSVYGTTPFLRATKNLSDTIESAKKSLLRKMNSRGFKGSNLSYESLATRLDDQVERIRDSEDPIAEDLTEPSSTDGTSVFGSKISDKLKSQLSEALLTTKSSARKMSTEALNNLRSLLNEIAETDADKKIVADNIKTSYQDTYDSLNRLLFKSNTIIESENLTNVLHDVYTLLSSEKFSDYVKQETDKATGKASAKKRTQARKDETKLGNNPNPTGRFAQKNPQFQSALVRLLTTGEGSLTEVLRTIQMPGRVLKFRVKSLSRPVMDVFAQATLDVARTMKWEPLLIREPKPLKTDKGLMEAWYDKATQSIHLTDAAMESPYALLHELWHFYTDKGFDSVDAGLLSGKEYDKYSMQEEAYMAIKKIYDNFVNETSDNPDFAKARESMSEFISETFSNEKLQNYLRSKQFAEESKLTKTLSFGRSWWSGFIGAIHRFFVRKGKADPRQYKNIEDDLNTVVGLSGILVGRINAENVKASRYDGSRPRGDSAGLTPNYASVYRNLERSERSRDKGAPIREELGFLELLDSNEVLYHAEGKEAVGLHDQMLFNSMQEARDYIRSLSSEDGAIGQFEVDNYQIQAPFRSTLFQKAVIINPTIAKYGEKVLDLINKVFGNRPELRNRLYDAAEKITLYMAKAYLLMRSSAYSQASMLNAMVRAAKIMDPDFEFKHGDPEKYFESMFSEAVNLTNRPGSVGTEFRHQVLKKMKELGIDRIRFGKWAYMKSAEEREATREYTGRNVFAGTTIENVALEGFRYTDKNGNVYRGREGAAKFKETLTDKEVEAYEAMFAPLRERTRSMLSRAEESSLISSQTATRLRKLKYYLPLRTNSDERSGVISKSEGRVTEADDPIAALLEDVPALEARAIGNQMRLDFAELAAASGLGELIDTGSWSVKADGTTAKDTRFAREIPYSIEGTTHTIKVRDTPWAKHIASAFGDNPVNLNAASNTVRYLTRISSMGHTTVNPGFWIKTFGWDTMLALTNVGQFKKGMTIAEGYKISSKGLGYALKILPNMAKAAWTEAVTGGDAYLYKKYLQKGGGSNVGAATPNYESMLNILGTSDTSVNKDSMFKSLPDKFKSPLRKAVDSVHAYNAAVRFGLTKAFLEHESGVDLGKMTEAQIDSFIESNPALFNQAMRGSREVLGNFARHGTQRFMSAYIPFANAAMQGLPIIKSLATTPNGMLGIALLGSLSIIAAQAMLDDPDDKLPDGSSKFARNGDWTNSITFGSYKTSLDYGLRIFVAPIVGTVLYMQNKISGKDLFDKVLSTASQSLTPYEVDPSSQNPAATLISSVSGTLGQIAFPLLGINRYGRAIDRQYPTDAKGKQLIGAAGSDLSGPEVNPLMNTLFDMAHETLGVDIPLVTPGRLDVMLKNMFGGFYELSTLWANPQIRDNPDNSALDRYKDYVFKAVTYKPSDYPIIRAYQTTRDDMLRSERRASGDIIKQNRVSRIDKELNRQLARLKVDGKNYTQIQAGFKEAKNNFDEAGISYYSTLYQDMSAKRSELYGKAKAKLDALEGYGI